MNFKQVGLVLVLGFSYLGAVQAASIGFNAGANNFEVGDSGSLPINIDFSGVNDESIGGSFRISYDDSIFSNVSFNFAADLLTSFGIDTAIEDHSISGNVDITIGTFSFTTGVTGLGELGVLAFDTFSDGVSALALADLSGGFSDFQFLGPQIINYSDMPVTVTPSSVVPTPPAAWLLMSGLGGLVSLRRKKLV